MPNFEFNTFDEAMAAIEAAAKNAVAESEGEVGEDDASHDIAIAFFSQMSPEVRTAIAQSYLGWDPEDTWDRENYTRHGVDLPT